MPDVGDADDNGDVVDDINIASICVLNRPPHQGAMAVVKRFIVALVMAVVINAVMIIIALTLLCS